MMCNLYLFTIWGIPTRHMTLPSKVTSDQQRTLNVSSHPPQHMHFPHQHPTHLPWRLLVATLWLPILPSDLAQGLWTCLVAAVTPNLICHHCTLMLPVEMWASWHYLHTHPNILQEPDKTWVQGCTSPQSIRRTFRITQLKRSSLHFEKCLVSQRIEECKMTLEALEDRMLELEEGIVHSTHTVGNMHSFMDQIGILIPDVPEHIAASIMFLEVSPSLLSDLSATYTGHFTI